MHWFNFSAQDFTFSFLSVLFEGVPFLLLGSIISGLVDVFVSSERMQRLMPKNSGAAIAISGLLGLVFPMCECGSVIVIRRFIKKGLPLSSAVTYMLASPIVSPLVALSTYAAFKGNNPGTMTFLRLSIGYLIAVAIGFIVSRLRAETILHPSALMAPNASRRAALTVTAAPAEEQQPQQDFSTVVAGASFPKKLLLSVQSATADFLDVGFFLIIGTAIAAVFNTAVKQDIILPLATNPPTAIASLMLLAAALALCSTTDAFIAATFKAFPFAAKLGFLLFGPVFDLKLFWLYGVLFKRRFIILLALGLFVAIWLICWRISALDLDALPMGPLPR
jgi:uncharacterized protein